VSLNDDLRRELETLREAGLLREPSDAAGAATDVTRNDYLGYAHRVVSRETVAPLGAGASRLIFGTRPEHLALEAEVADWVAQPAALLFSSGYVANLATVSALVRPGDTVISDELNHASIIDGCRLCRGRTVVVPHLDREAMETALAMPCEGRRWVVTESYFSMDGDSPDLVALRALCDRYDAAMIVDEAHALGIFGDSGAGLCRAAGIVPDVQMGGFGKAVGSQGAFIAGSRAVIETLWNRARGFVFSTGMSPLLAEFTLDNVRAVRRDDLARDRLGNLCRRFEERLEGAPSGFSKGRHGPIFPVVFGSEERALRASRRLRDEGFLTQAIRPPTVASGASRLRVALHADLDEERALMLADSLRRLCLES
jgi:8-amino-7-oxononanoate synthase